MAAFYFDTLAIDMLVERKATIMIQRIL